MGTGWEQLHCPYFRDACLHVLEDYFRCEGFSQHHADRVGGVVFEGENCYVEVSYEAETYPRYSPTLIIGMGSDAYDEALSVTGVPFWFLIPSTNESSKYTLWKFGAEAELLSVLERIKNDIIQPFGRLLWEDIEVLKKAVDRFKVEHVGSSSL